MQTLRYAFLSALLLCVAPACNLQNDPLDQKQGDGGTDGGDQGDGGNEDGGEKRTLPAEPTLEELEAYWAEKSCRVYACMNHLRDTPEVCELARKATGFPFDIFRKALKSVASGRATYVNDAGVFCGEMLTNIETDFDCFGEFAITYEERYFDELRALCGEKALLAGTVEHGGECDSDAECVPTADCKRDRQPDCKGVCVTRLLVNEACDGGRWNDCVSTAQCDGSVCVAKTYKKDNEWCFDHDECASGKCFRRSGSISSICTSKSGQEGDECGDYSSSEIYQDEHCASGLHCRPLPASSGMAGVCEEPRRAGETCWYAQRCKGNQPCAGFFRKYGGGQQEGTCTIRPANVGGDCVPLPDDFDYGQTGCFADLTCNPETSKCEEPPAVGEPCAQPGNRCGFAAYCDEGGTCRAKKAPGEEATDAGQCLNDFNSYDKKCEDRSAQAGCGF